MPTVLPETTITPSTLQLPAETITAGQVSLPALELTSDALASAAVPDNLGTTLAYIDETGAIRILAFDATIRTVHTGISDITEYPVDSGADKADHAQPKSRRISIEAEVTNTPIYTEAELPGLGKPGSVQAVQIPVRFFDWRKSATAKGGRGRTFAATGFGTFNVGGSDIEVTPSVVSTNVAPIRPQLLKFTSEFSRVKEVYAALHALRLNRTLVRVDSAVEKYPGNCQIASVVVTEEVSDSAMLNIELVELDLVTNESTDAQARTTEARPKKPTHTGKGGYVNEPENETTARKGLDAATGALGRNSRPAS